MGAVMPQRAGRGLSLAEWLVLCLVSEGPTYGFAIAGLLARGGSLGRVWHVHKTVVYRAVARLERLGLITVSEKRPSSLGPDWAELEVTSEGRLAADGWLRQPAGHPRDIRSELLLKLALLDRAGGDPGDLLRAQRGRLVVVSDALAGEMSAASGYDQVVARWRHESVTAALRFVDGLLTAVPVQRPGPADSRR
jgi:PadR family transcriptional regulator AphA